MVSVGTGPRPWARAEAGTGTVPILGPGDGERSGIDDPRETDPATGERDRTADPMAMVTLGPRFADAVAAALGLPPPAPRREGPALGPRPDGPARSAMAAPTPRAGNPRGVVEQPVTSAPAAAASPPGTAAPATAASPPGTAAPATAPSRPGTATPATAASPPAPAAPAAASAPPGTAAPAPAPTPPATAAPAPTPPEPSPAGGTPPPTIEGVTERLVDRLLDATTARAAPSPAAQPTTPRLPGASPETASPTAPGTPSSSPEPAAAAPAVSGAAPDPRGSGAVPGPPGRAPAAAAVLRPPGTAADLPADASPTAAVRIRIHDHGEGATVRLRHPELGQLELRVALEGRRLTVLAQAGAHSAARALRAAEPLLRAGMAREGIELGALRIARRRVTTPKTSRAAEPDLRKRGARRRRDLDLEA